MEVPFLEVVLVFLAPYVPNDGISKDVPWCIFGDGTLASNVPECRGILKVHVVDCRDWKGVVECNLVGGIGGVWIHELHGHNIFFPSQCDP